MESNNLYILEAKDFRTMANVINDQPRYDVLSHGDYKIECISDFISGVWSVFITKNDEKPFTEEEINMVNIYLKQINREITCKGTTKIGLKFDKDVDVLPTTNRNYGNFNGKSYKTLAYARMIGISMAQSVIDLYENKPDNFLEGGKFL